MAPFSKLPNFRTMVEVHVAEFDDRGHQFISQLLFRKACIVEYTRREYENDLCNCYS